MKVDSSTLPREPAASRLSAVVQRSPWLSSLLSLRGQARYRLGLRPHASGATTARLGLEAMISYARRCADDYLRYAGVDDRYLEGKRVLELGPGDSVCTALCLLARGAQRVVCVEAFDPPVDDARNAALYRALLDSFGARERALAERGVRFVSRDRAELDPDHVCLYRKTRIDAAGTMTGERFDVIVSRAVLEHVGCVARTWSAMVALLDSGGAMWHKIDLRHHGYFAGVHPLHFLTPSDLAWRWMSSPDPTLNRSRADLYRSLAARDFERVSILTTHVLDGDEIVPHVERATYGTHFGAREVDQVRAIRPRLRPRFRALSDEDLLVSGIFLVASGLRYHRPSP